MGISVKLRRRIFRRDGWRCLICKTSKNLTIDHILPVALGGKTTPGNLQTLCKYHNQQKGSTTVVDYRNRKGLPSMSPYIGSMEMKLALINGTVGGTERVVANP